MLCRDQPNCHEGRHAQTSRHPDSQTDHPVADHLAELRNQRMTFLFSVPPAQKRNAGSVEFRGRHVLRFTASDIVSLLLEFYCTGCNSCCWW